MKNKNKKGFTLIELLIVIAIIGILASIVLVSLNSARTKAKYASFEASVSSIKGVAVVCVDGGGAPSTAAAGAAICDDTAITDAVYPTLPIGCTSAGDFTVGGSGDDWTITQSCDATCSGVCSSTGCVYTGC
jgi:prepilin-type N-terminal cleavage/methylation domain-containing protein